MTLSNIVLEVFDLFNSEAKCKNISLKNDQSEEINFFAVINMFQTIIRNLISNALKFSKSDSQILVSGRSVNGCIEVIIADTGIGMNEETTNKLFDIDKETTLDNNNKKGVGLGLILCKEFIEKHGGKIEVESELGKGSLFKFSIPLQL